MDTRWYCHLAVGHLRDETAEGSPAGRRRATQSLPVSGLLFDLGGVLYDDTLWQRWLWQLVCRMGRTLDYGTFARGWQGQYLDEVNWGCRDSWEALRAFLLALGLSRGQTAEVLAASHGRYRQFEENIRPLPGVGSTLSRLASYGIPLGLFCNAPWPTGRVAEKLDQLRLTVHFPRVLTSLDLGCRHSTGNPFQAACAALHLVPAHTAYVGRNSRLLQQAADAGLPTVAVNYDPGASADLYLEQFDQLPDSVHFQSSHALAG